jgi:hypothetical protein
LYDFGVPKSPCPESPCPISVKVFPKLARREATRKPPVLSVVVRFNQQRKVNFMKPLKLYKIARTDDQPVHIVARSHHEAADLFATWSAAHGRIHGSFRVEIERIDHLNSKQQGHARSASAAAPVGIWHFDEEIGWTFSPPMWVPLGHDEPPTGDHGASR